MNIATFLTLEALLFALLLFALRVLNYAVSTVRLVFIARGRRFLSSVLAFLEALIFALVIANVVNDLQNVVNLIAYCLGASVGNYVGMVLEARLFKTFNTVQVISPQHGEAIAKALRDNGFAVTETVGRGRDGEVTILRTAVMSRYIPRVMEIVRDVQPDAFIEVESATVYHGWMPGVPPYRPPRGKA